MTRRTIRHRRGKSPESQKIKRDALQKMLGLGANEEPYCVTCGEERRNETPLVVLTMSHRKPGQGSRDRKKKFGGQNVYRAVLGRVVQKRKYSLQWLRGRFIVECMNHNLIRDNQGFGISPSLPKEMERREKGPGIPEDEGRRKLGGAPEAGESSRN